VLSWCQSTSRRREDGSEGEGGGDGPAVCEHGDALPVGRAHVGGGAGAAGRVIAGGGPAGRGQAVVTRAELTAAWDRGAVRFEVRGPGGRTEGEATLPTGYTIADFHVVPEAERGEAWRRYALIQPLLAVPGVSAPGAPSSTISRPVGPAWSGTRARSRRVGVISGPYARQRQGRRPSAVVRGRTPRPAPPHPRRVPLVSLHRRPIVLCQETAQRAQPEAEASLDRAEGDALGVGNLGVGVAGGVGEGERGALGRGQVDEGGTHAADLGVLAGQVVRVGTVGGRGQGRDIDPAVVVAATVIVDGAVAHDGQEPGADAAARGVVGGGAAPDGQERLLEGILDERGVVEDALGQHRGHRGVASIELVERGTVAGRDAGEQRAVGGGRNVHRVLIPM